MNPILEYVLESPPEHKPPRSKHNDLLTDFLMILIVFGFSMWLRYAVYDWFFANFTDEFFLVVRSENWFTRLMGWELGDEIQTEGYFDLSAYYYPYVDYFKDGWNPYNGGRIPGDKTSGYVYGPFYIILIALPAMLFDMTAHESVLISNFVFDSLTAVMIYIISRRYTGNLNAVSFSILYSVSPVVLYYYDIKLLNTPQMTFFSLVAVWAFLEHRDHMAMFFIAYSFMIKQFPILFAMPFLMLYVRRYGWANGFTYMFELFFYVILLSYPFSVMSPYLFIAKMITGGSAKTVLPSIEVARIETSKTANLVYGALFSPEDTTLDVILFALVNSHVFFFVTLFTISWFAFSSYRLMEARPVLYLRFFAAYQFLAHATIARGIYKYYTPFLLAFAVMAFIPDKRPNSFNLEIGRMLNRMIQTVISIDYQKDVPPRKYWMNFLFTGAFFVTIYFISHWAISLFIPDNGMRILLSVISFGVIWFLSLISDCAKGEVAEDPSDALYSVKVKGHPIVSKYSPIIILIASWVFAVIAVVFLFNFVYWRFYESFQPILSSFSTLLIAMISGIHALKKTKLLSEHITLNLALASVLFYFIRFQLLTPDLFYLYVVLGFDASGIVSTVISMGIVLGMLNIIDQLIRMEQQISSVKDSPEEPEVVIQVAKELKVHIDRSIFYTIMYFSIFIIDQFALEFFKGNEQLYHKWTLAAMVGMLILMFATDIEHWIRYPEKKYMLYKFEVTTALVDGVYIALTTSLFVLLNHWILEVDRLLTPTLIFGFGIFLIGCMGWEFWLAGLSYPVREIDDLYQRLEKAGKPETS